MKSIRQTFFALTVAAFLGATAPVSAQVLISSIDQSDLWWIPTESGWGMQLVDRNNVIFATLFVYGPSGAPTWYVATMNFVSGATWTGDLYATTGPWFGTMPFNPNNVTATKVGTMTWMAGIDAGNVTYTVNGVVVSKNVIRQTLVLNNYNGHFFGVIHQTATGCSNPALDGDSDVVTVLNIAQSGTAITVTSLPAVGGSCTFTGTLQQDGQMGLVIGSYTCSAGFAGNFEIAEFQVNEVSVNGAFGAQASNPAGCQFAGWLGGLAVTTF